MGKHEAGKAEGTSNQKAQEAQERAELKALEEKLRKEGKIK